MCLKPDTLKQTLRKVLINLIIAAVLGYLPFLSMDHSLTILSHYSYTLVVATNSIDHLDCFDELHQYALDVFKLSLIHI